MKHMFSFIVCFCLLVPPVVVAETNIMESATPLPGMRGTPLNLPDISVVGVLDGHVSDDKTDSAKDRLELSDVETAFQGYIYPEMRADVFLAIHRHDGEYEAEICEAKASFLHLADGLGGEAGKIHVNFGKLNRIHEHHRPMIDQPLVLTNFFGDHGLVGQGGTLNYLMPLPFFLQFEGGAWRVAGHHPHVSEDVETTQVTDVNGNVVDVAIYEEEPCTEFSLADEVYTGRAKTSFAPTAKSELEIGGSIAQGRGGHYEEHLDKAQVVGADMTFRFWPTAYRRWTFQNEWMHLRREVPVGILHRQGGYSFLQCRLNKYWDVGARFDYADNAFPDKVIERSGSAIVGYHLTETSDLRIQAKRRRVGDDDISEGWVRMTFGIGPHSHELE